MRLDTDTGQLRNVMKIPVPNVLAWSSTSGNKVGAEYILMEDMRGVQLSKLWDQLEVDVKFKILRNIARYQEKWLDTTFSRYGSLYYKNDVGLTTPSVEYTDKSGVTIVDNRFTIGPSVSRQNNDDGRLEMHFDRGPCKSLFFICHYVMLTCCRDYCSRL